MYFTIKKKKDFHPCQNGQYGSPVLSNGNGGTEYQKLVTISK